MSLNAAMMSSASPEWCTPAHVLDLVRQVAPIGLDPCTNSKSIVDATVEWNRADDSLNVRWTERGLVFLNPPYGRTIGDWVEKAATEAANTAEIIALLPARTDARWFDNVWHAQAICFWRGRIKFLGAESSAPFPSCVAYWGPNKFRFADVFRTAGRVVMP